MDCNRYFSRSGYWHGFNERMHAKQNDYGEIIQQENMQKSIELFLISLVCIAVILVTGCTSTGSNPVAPVQTAVPTSVVTTPAATFTTTATISPSMAPTTVPTVISTTQTPVNDGLSVTLNSAKRKTTTYSGGSLPPGIVLLELDITIQNNDKHKDFEYTDSSFVLSFKSNKISLTAKTTQYAKGLINPFIGAPVPSGSEKTGRIIFGVNETSNYYKLSVVDSTGTVQTSIDNINVP